MTRRKKVYETARRDGNHWARIPNPLWDEVEEARGRDLDLAVEDGVSLAIVKLLREALDARKRKRSKSRAA